MWPSFWISKKERDKLNIWGYQKKKKKVIGQIKEVVEEAKKAVSGLPKTWDVLKRVNRKQQRLVKRRNFYSRKIKEIREERTKKKKKQ